MAEDTTGDGPGDLVEAIVTELRKKRDFLRQLPWPGKLIVHINFSNKNEPIRLEAQVKL
jgi:hypothetical protein